MNTSTKIRIIIWSVVGVFVIAVFFVLLINPSFMPFDFNGISFVGFDEISYENSSSYTAGNTSLPSDNIKSIEIEWTAGEVEVVTADTDKITIEEASNSELTENSRLHWYLDSNELKIRFCAAGRFRLNIQKKLIITLPEKLVLNELSAETVSANISVSNFSVNKLDTETVSGTIKLSAITAQKTELESTSGNIDVNGLFTNNISTDSISGNTYISLADDCCPVEANFSTVSGNITLMLPESSGFTAEISSVSGDTQTDFPCTVSGNTYICGDGKCDFSFDSVSGDFLIKMK